MDSASLANEALKLPPSERAQIIDTLWRSLDPAEQGAIDGEAALRAIEDEIKR